jgi:preprotein translocase subunit SecE
MNYEQIYEYGSENMADQNVARSVSAKRYFKDTVAELKKVIWPNRKDVTNSTTAVIGSVMIIGLLIWVFDAGLNYVISTWLVGSK